jgi:hypothetical protein
MTTISSWVQWVWSNRARERLAVESIPAFDACELFFMHIDERAEVTVAYVGRISSGEAAYMQADAGHTALEFFLKFERVSCLTVNGWTHLPMQVLSVERGSGGGVCVAIRGDGTDTTFDCETVSLEKARTYAAGLP